MKNLFLCLTFTLVSFCSFAKSEKQSNVLSYKIKIAKFSAHAEQVVNYADINYVYDGASCYVEIYYKGELVHTIHRYATGTSSFDAQLNCLGAARNAANDFIAMQESSISQN